MTKQPAHNKEPVYRISFFNQGQVYEIYARHIGLVYKEATVLEYCTVGDCIGKQQIEKGYTLKQTLTAYGKE